MLRPAPSPWLHVGNLATLPTPPAPARRRGGDLTAITTAPAARSFAALPHHPPPPPCPTRRGCTPATSLPRPHLSLLCASDLTSANLPKEHPREDSLP
jgi:hypothetical protein